ncbi:MAG: hypothetical protein M3R15_13990, partial [Acidobacteriota bacterium]|nr:hypothetical protein [Acidobacteriota bacterium]
QPSWDWFSLPPSSARRAEVGEVCLLISRSSEAHPFYTLSEHLKATGAQPTPATSPSTTLRRKKAEPP